MPIERFSEIGPRTPGTNTMFDGRLENDDF